ncbi:general secretion pathway protein L [Trinickia symbiotica]|uniref:Type II secretion system protein GspL n=1 Tax=Trinickia symbiotica TaxID=863227 RepID=A0A2N7X770_9BURK|nr:type II secretion system protein GspL [Trinickia symbiotica]PMS37613.1 type II secretion system protein GspL [Trinickia symbiotica]PPK43968.1 general secretion pathway protein L [Trinickia symbiotica]
MSTLIVFLPPRDPAVPSQEWLLPDMPFLLLDKSGRKERAGRAGLAFLPRAATTVLIVAARDVLMLSASLPPLKGQRLKQALPNVVEDQMIQDPQTCHIALDPQPLADGSRVLAVIDRGWFRFLVEAFAAAGHRNLRAVPVTRCLPAAQSAPGGLAESGAIGGQDEPPVAAALAGGEAGAAAASQPESPLLSPASLVVAVLGTVRETAQAILADAAAGAASVVPEAPSPSSAPLASADPRVEVAIARGSLGEGLAVPASALEATLSALAGDTPLDVFELTDVPGAEPALAPHAALPMFGRASSDARIVLPAGAKPLPFEALARAAIASRLDLCQFEFESRPWRLDRATVRRLRVPIGLGVAALLVAVIGANVQWIVMARERDALNAQMTELLLNAFPKTTVVLDAPAQMKSQLDRLRLASGQLSPDDFLSLAARLARSLGPLPVNGIAALDYHDRRLDLTFKPQVSADPDFTKRLAQSGLAGELDSGTGKWAIKNRNPGQ